jgi:hypothetical protein
MFMNLWLLRWKFFASLANISFSRSKPPLSKIAISFLLGYSYTYRMFLCRIHVTFYGHAAGIPGQGMIYYMKRLKIQSISGLDSNLQIQYEDRSNMDV